MLAIAAIGAGTAAYSSYQQGKNAEEQGKFNAATQKVNQITAQQQADADLGRIREKYRRIHSTQRAQGAIAGLTTSGSFGDLLYDTNLQEDLDVLSTLYQTKVDITGAEQRRKLALMQGAQGKQEGNLAAAGSIISAAGSAYGQYPTIAN